VAALALPEKLAEQGYQENDMTTPTIDEAQIRETAYLMWLDEGQPHGRDQDHWLKAIDALNAPQPKVRKPAKRRASTAKKAAPKAAAAKKSPARKASATKSAKKA
jgi:hypothetical protein